MAQNYTRQSTLSDGDTITASLFNDEYNQLVNAFTYSSTSASSTGHRHDGSSGQGGNIFKIGDLDFLNKIEVDSTNNRWGFYVEVSSAAVEQIRIQDGAVVPVTTNDIDLGTSSLQFKDLYIDGTANVDSLTLTSGSTVTTILDEDDLSSDSATALVTQQSVKAYVDSQVTAQDLDFQADSGGALSIDLDSEALTLTGGTGIDTSGSGNAVTFAIDSTVTTLAGTQTLTNKTLTSPDVNTPDIDGGTIDGTVIGGSTAAAGSFTTVSATGNITVGGTVDGRDVATDGTKLDTVETNADVTDTTNVTAAGALMDSEVTNLTAVKSLDQGVATTDSPTFAGLTTTADVSFGDNDKAIFGDSSDLQIYHASSQSYIEDAGSGNLNFKSNGNNFNFLDGSDNVVLQIDMDSETTLYHNTSAKLATTSTGVDVTGTLVADGLTSQAGANATDILSLSGSAAGRTLTVQSYDTTLGGAGFDINASASAGEITLQTNTKDRLRVEANGDISFYEYTGTTAKLFWDASAEFLGIGTGSPSSVLHLSTSNDPRITLTDTGFGASADITATNGNLRLNSQTATIFGMADSQVMRLDTNGNLLVSKTSNDNSTAGVVLRNTGEGSFVTSGQRSGLFNRLSSDGEIINFRNGATVGSIGVASSELYFSSGNTGLYFDDVNNLIRPTNNAGALRDNTVDLGKSDSRFKDLYLSGGLRGDTLTFSSNAGTEAMRITSGGHLLVGKTSQDSTNTVGFEAKDDGLAVATTDGSQSLVLNRKTSDGTIAEFRKDNSAVGTISAASTNIIYGNDTRGLKIEDTLIIPRDVDDTTADNQMDLGSSTSRWKDLYLSGGVIGDTFGTSTNKLSYSIANTARIFTGGSERMRIDSSGNVGIGTTSPQGPLQVSLNSSRNLVVGFDTEGDSRVSLRSIEDVANNLRPIQVEGSEIILGTAAFDQTVSSEAMRIDSSGNVGIGATSPQGPLHVQLSSARNLVVDFDTEGDSRTSLRSIENTANNLRPIQIEGQEIVLGTAAFDQTVSAERMRIDSIGNVGIGTTPATNTRLHVVDSISTYLKLERTGATAGVLLIGAESGVNTIYSRDSSTGAAPLKFVSGTSEAMRIDASGRVGIGTTSPAEELHIAAGYPVIRLEDSDSTGNAYAEIQSSNGDLYLMADQGQDTGSSKLSLWVDASERARVDSSGNLLVGKTGSAFSVAGHEINSDGLLVSTRDGDNVAVLNRETSDGSILQFRKDNSAVGSIGSRAGTVLYITSTGTNETGLDFGGTSINPMLSGSLSNGTTDLGNTGNRFKDLYLSGGVKNSSSIYMGRTDLNTSVWIGNSTVNPGDSSGAVRDDAVSLGYSTGRFKNLYLSGGAYLGGTAAANKLDDYEEGTWTPGIASASGSFTTLTYSVQHGTYTKIGDTVRLTCVVATSNVSVGTASGAITITGNPFAFNSASNAPVSGAIGTAVRFATDMPNLRVYGNNGQYSLALQKGATNITGNFDLVDVTDLTTGASAFRNYFSATFVFKTT